MVRPEWRGGAMTSSTPPCARCGAAGPAQPPRGDGSSPTSAPPAITIRTLALLTGILVCALAVPAQAITWQLEIEQGEAKSWSLPITNSCTTSHEFTIKPPEEVSLKREMPVLVPPGEKVEIDIVLDAADLEPGRYSRQLEVLCDDCGREPGCAQDRRVFDLEIEVRRGPCLCRKVTVRAGPARTTGSGGLVVDGVLTAELSRRFTFDLECRGKQAEGPAGTCVERVGVQTTGLQVELSDGTSSATLTPTSEEAEGGKGIRLECACRRSGKCDGRKRVDVVYRASLDIPVWAVDDLSAQPPRRVDADIHATWQPVSETGFCNLATVPGFNGDTVEDKVLRIR